MSSFIFNEFKKRFLKGEVNNEGIKWTFTPVKKDFIENLNGENIKPEQFKTKKSIESFLENNGGYEKMISDLYQVEYAYSKLVEAKYSNKPAYITPENFSDFLRANPKENNLWNYFFTVGQADSYFAGRGGFYYVKTKEELKWCANRVNGDNDDGERGDNFNNHINIVLGDDIGEKEDKTEINFCIGRYPDRPFEGLLYGNGYVFQNIRFIVNKDVNGIVGHLGHYGIINNINIFGNTEVVCQKKINLAHIKNVGTDICFGGICGINRGLIQLCRFSSVSKDQQNTIPTVTFKGFVPQVYTVQNKTENVNVPATDSKDNEFYPNYFCINSPGNIIPYVGYFNEGCAAVVSGKEFSKPGFWLDDVNDKNTDWNGTLLYGDNQDEKDGVPADANGYGNQFYFDHDNLKNTAQSLGLTSIRDAKLGFNSIDYYNKELLKSHQNCHAITNNWVNRPLKLHQFARAAYYVSPFCGWNKGTIEGCESKAKAVFEGTFVGFCGGLVGKSAGGKIVGCNVYISPNDDDKCSRDIFMVSAASNISEYSPLIDFRNDLQTFKNIYHQDSDDIANRALTSNEYTPENSAAAISADYMKNNADVFTWDEDSHVNLYHDPLSIDPLGVCQCPWHKKVQGLMLQFNGLSAENSTIKTATYTFDSSSAVPASNDYNIVAGNSALNIYNIAMSTGSFTSGEGYTFSETSTNGGKSKIYTGNRIHKTFYDQYKFTDDINKPVYDFTSGVSAVWYPLIPNADALVYTDFKYDPDTNCYVVKNAQFKLGCGYTVVPNQDWIQSGNKSHENYIVDEVYPDFYNADGSYLLRTQKDSKFNHPIPDNATYTDTSWNSTTNVIYNAKIDRLDAPNGNFTCGIEFDQNASFNEIFYKNSVDFTSAAYISVPTVIIDEIYLAPFTQDGKNNNIQKYINNETEYIEGMPLGVVKMKGIHVKNRYSHITPRIDGATKTVITISDYEFTIKAIGVIGPNHSRSDINTQYPNIDDNKVNAVYEFYNCGSNYDPYHATKGIRRNFIGNCAFTSIFELSDNARDPFSSMIKPQYKLDVKVGSIGESFRTELQSIYNIGGLIGSLSIAPQVTEIYNTSAFLDNHISEGLIVSANSAKSATTYIFNDVSSKNYAFLDRFGGLAAICEFNTSNIGDDAPCPIVCSNVNVHYEEETAAQRIWDSVDTTVNSAFYKKRDFYGPIQLNGDNATCPFGIGSPIVAEIKPTYNMFPGINSYINTWKGDQPEANATDSETAPQEVHGYAYYGAYSNDLGLMYNDYNLGLYTLDLNVDTPVKNMMVDSNASNIDTYTYKYGWMPGLNIANAKNEGGLPFLAQNLFRGINVKQNYYGYIDPNNPNNIIQGAGYRRSPNVLETIHYPASICRDISLTQDHRHVYNSNIKKSYTYDTYKYATSKHESTYSYFGSSLAIDYNHSGKKIYNDVYISYQSDWSVCPTTGPDLTNAKLPNYSRDYFKTHDEIDQFFTYTYSATSASYGTDGNLKKLGELKYDVKFAIDNNGKIGYWLEDPIAGISGHNFVYNHNIMHLGITKSPEQIRKEIIQKGICYTSAISGEDFAGLWVYDDKGNNVMYIDTSVGDCDGLSTWSMQLSEGKVDGKQMGCILEIK